MSEVKWIKLSTGLFDNRKIQALEVMPDGDSLIVIWLKLLCLAGNVNDGGLVYFTKDIAYTEEMLANQFHRPLQTVRLALDMFQRFGMITITNDVLEISNWQKYQSADKLEQIRSQNAERQRRFKERKRTELLAGNVTDNTEITQGNALDIDIDIDKDKEIDIEVSTAKRQRFKPPTVQEVADYIQQMNYSVDAQRFVDWYKMKGWQVGKSKMKDWKAAVRTWQSKEADKNSKNDNKYGFTDISGLIDQI